jgi:hypothetical protein
MAPWQLLEMATLGKVYEVVPWALDLASSLSTVLLFL